MTQLKNCPEVVSWDPATLLIWFLLLLIVIVVGLSLAAGLWMLRDQAFFIDRLINKQLVIQEAKNDTDERTARAIETLGARLEKWQKNPGSFFGYGP